jgi:hypothetical protein
MYENRTMKLAEIVLRKRGRETRNSYRRNEFAWGTLYACMDMSQQNPFV